MQKIVAALALSGAAAFVAPVAPAAGTALNGKEEMQALAESNPDLLGRTIGFWDPFNLIAEGDFWGLGNEATIGYLRHAEIKHGRVAMAAVVGFLVQSQGLTWGVPFTFDGLMIQGGSPPEQWDALPLLAKAQIFTFIGFLEVCHRRSRTAAALSRPAPERRRPTRRPALCGLPHPSRTAPVR